MPVLAHLQVSGVDSQVRRVALDRNDVEFTVRSHFSCTQPSRALSRLAANSALVAWGSVQVDEAFRLGYVWSHTSLLNPIEEIHSVLSLVACTAMRLDAAAHAAP